MLDTAPWSPHRECATERRSRVIRLEMLVRVAVTFLPCATHAWLLLHPARVAVPSRLHGRHHAYARQAFLGVDTRLGRRMGGEKKAAEGVYPMTALGTVGLHRRYSMKAGRGGVSFTPVAPRGTPSGRAIETGVAGLGERPIAEHCRIEIVACRPPSIDPSPERTCGTRSNLPRDAAFRQWRPWGVSSTSHLPLHGNLDHDFHPTSRHRKIFQS
ncbi:uncharacterized protein K489DRAFT_86734 [Dissoconium aciculare CBS 342.82]|uniref:Uncharacterized protein n=1 Tax=Dissoconium aciculare CBS 342.82 TaxID=1314786 RepID=A0A6J3LTC2_9PEZI|nr:uncharacterized protein K489DRAFT_86734 [Dissoconium aciculare CBS 342.82]KAF1819031.1 hypothetical protein K489DRAFT_86734 [Dissoconium aciculare CBS 342.82]